MEVVATIVRGVNDSRDARAALERAEVALTAAMEKSSERATFLTALAAERDAGRLSQVAYQRLMGTAARLLKGQADLADECLRVVTMGDS
ncbi:MAG: hypothetical protein CMN31_23785 [Sandaracinus sp.]|nr:hypothetical protein [Sandaracinus sp.]HJL28348.1 hypothetical protein [Polyangiaceae bacterium LLY-WYZ-15_(1-7)]